MILTTSAAGRMLIMEHEGFRATPAPLPQGGWVVGYGHVRMDAPGARVTRAEATRLLGDDLRPFERMVGAAVQTPLTQAQFDALVSFAFSVGVEAFAASQVLRRVNGGDIFAAACALDAWRKSDASGELEIVDALVRRRAAEKAMLLQDAPCAAAPSALLRARLDHAASVLGAPIAYASAPALAAGAVDDGVRITQILMSEPATAAVLTAPPAPLDPLEDEIITAHARPVARLLDGSPLARRSERRGAEFRARLESVGLFGLLFFGLLLVSIGAPKLLGGARDLIDIGAGAALSAPGLAAAFIAGFGFIRGHAAA